MNARIPVLVLAALCATFSFAQGKPVTCPVTRLDIPSAKVAVAKKVYKGKTYYFCTMNCKKCFDKNPKKYVK